MKNKEVTEMKTESQSKKRPRKQDDLPEMKGKGVEKMVVPEIEDAAEEFIQLREQSKAMKTEISTAKQTLIEAMATVGLANYEYDGKIITITPKKEDVKIKLLGEIAIEAGEAVADE